MRWGVENTQDPVTKEQSLELVRHGLVPGHLISRMSARQANAMLRRHRRKRLGIFAVRVFIGVVILCSLSVIGYKAWERWGGPSKESVGKPVGPVSDRVTVRWKLGSWAPWIGDERHALVLERLPTDAETSLRRQNELFQAVLERDSQEAEGLDAADIVRWQSRFPGGEDVTASYATTRSRSHATAFDDHASAGSTLRVTPPPDKKGCWCPYRIDIKPSCGSSSRS